MKRRDLYFLTGLLITLTIPSILLGQQQKTEVETRGLQGVRVGHTVAAVKQAYGSEYGNLVQQFYDSAGNVGNPANAPTSYSSTPPGSSAPNTYQPYGQGANQQILNVMIDVVKEVYLNGRYQAVPVVDGDTLTQRDHYKIIFKSNLNCYLYVVQLDSTGKIDPLFPSQFTALNNPVEQNVLYEIPSDNQWFFLDANTGIETIYFIASQTRRGDIEQVLQKLQRRNSSLIQRQPISMNTSAVLTRGIKGIRAGKTQNISLMSGGQSAYTSTVIQSVQAEFVMTRYFNHR